MTLLAHLNALKKELIYASKLITDAALLAVVLSLGASSQPTTEPLRPYAKTADNFRLGV